MLYLFEEHNKICLVVAVLIAGFIFYMSSLVFPPGPVGFDIKPILYHFGVFFCLAFFLIAGLKGERKDVFWIFVAVVITMFYAVTDEFHQIFVSGRYGDFSDVMVDSIGAVSAGLIWGAGKFGK